MATRSWAGDDFLCSLYSGTETVPLRGLSVRARVVGMVSEVEVTQRYVNDTDAPLEAVFRFKQEECSIFGFEAIIDDRKVVGEVKEKEEALNAYEDAISSGGQGFLLAQDDKVKGAFVMNVGNLPPGKDCTITFRYASELANEGNNVRLTLPITRLSVLPLETTSTGDNIVRDGLHVDIDIEMPLPIHTVDCSSKHSISTQINDNTARIQLDSSTSASSSGLVILIGQQHIGEPQAIIEIDTEAKSAVAMISFIAELEQLRNADVIAEVIFIVDRSGSMSGSRIKQAQNALSLFLHSLPVGTRFNVIGFGSSYSMLFPKPAVYDDSTLTMANEYAHGLSANMGGTELMGPLHAVLSSPVDPMFPRQVFVLTDGEVSNTNEVIDYVRKNAKDTRVFTLGIGSDASTELVNGMAKAGQGQSEFVISGERMEAKVLRQLKRALQPVLKQPKVEFGRAREVDGYVVVKDQAPKALPAVFDGERVISYAFFNTTDISRIEEAISGAELKAWTDLEGGEEVRLKVVIGEKAHVKEGKLIHRLAARSLIRGMEESAEGADTHKIAITELAVRYGLVSTFTSFVASIEGEQAAEGTMHKVEIGNNFNPRKNTRLAEINAQIAEVKAVMLENIDKVLVRGESLDMLCERSEDLMATSASFSRRARDLRGGVFSSFINSVSSFFSPSNWSFGSSSSSSSSSSLSSPPDEDEATPTTSAVDCIAPADRKGADSAEGINNNLSVLDQAAFATPTNTMSASVALTPSRDAAHMRSIDKLVHYQRANGSWQLDANLVQGIGKPFDVLSAALPSGLPAEVWATALALAALEANFADLKEEWELLAEKAKRWLVRELTKLGGEDTPTVGSLISAAMAVLTS